MLWHESISVVLLTKYIVNLEINIHIMHSLQPWIWRRIFKVHVIFIELPIPSKSSNRHDHVTNFLSARLIGVAVTDHARISGQLVDKDFCQKIKIIGCVTTLRPLMSLCWSVGTRSFVIFIKRLKSHFHAPIVALVGAVLVNWPEWSTSSCHKNLLW